MIVDCAVYCKGVRREGALPLEEALEASREPGCFVWIGLHEPSPAEFDSVRIEFGLHELAVEDAVKAHQRPKVEAYDHDLFVVLKTARYIELSETVEFAELQLFVGASYVVTVRHGEASALKDVRKVLESNPDHLSHGPAAVLHAVMDRVVDDYLPVITGLDNDVREIEVDVFDIDRSQRADPTRRIYLLKREVFDFLRHTKPLAEGLARLQSGVMPQCPAELYPYFRDVQDHLLRAVTEIEGFRDTLTDAQNANLSQTSVRQNDDMRKISAVVAIAGVPTVVGAVYGMNFEHMPELGWSYGYPVVVAVTAIVCVLLYVRFKKSGWL